MSSQFETEYQYISTRMKIERVNQLLHELGLAFEVDLEEIAGGWEVVMYDIEFDVEDTPVAPYIAGNVA